MEVIAPFVREMDQPQLPPYQIIGGVGSAALADPRSELRLDTVEVVADSGLSLPTYRDDGNKRDLDVLVLSNDEDRIREVEAVAEDAIGDELEISVFGLKSLDQAEKQIAKPYRSSITKWLSDRYIDLDTGVGYKLLFPFAVDLPYDTLETWRLNIGGTVLPVPHPGTTLLNYLTRSISGLRAKDHDKVQKIATKVFSDSPDIADWISCGPGSSQFELARVLHSLREPSGDPQDLVLGETLSISPYPHAILRDHGAFLLDNWMAGRTRNVFAIARAKSRALRTAESNPKLVTMWQRFGEQKADVLIKNN